MMQFFQKLSIATVLLLWSQAAVGQLLPTGFVEESLVPLSSLRRPIALDFLPDGRCLLAEHHDGRVTVWDRGALKTLGFIPDLAIGIEDGLLGLAVDPQFPDRPWLYTYFTHDDGGGVRSHRIVRYRLAGDLRGDGDHSLTMVDPYVILKDVPAPNDFHNGGWLGFGPDGLLYLTTGDGNIACEAQNPDSLLGKVLRLDVRDLPKTGPTPPRSDLVPPGGNPFPATSDIAALVFALGLRNPFRAGFDPAAITPGLFLADVGQSSWEEINQALGGENFGWPWFEGPDPFSSCPPGPVPTNLTPPIVLGNHAPPASFTAAVPFGGVYRNVPGARFNFGSLYDGQIFLANLGFNAPLFRVAFDGMNWNPAPAAPGQSNSLVWGVIGFPTDCKRGPDGALWYTNFLTGELRRVRPSAGSTTLNVLGGRPQKGNAGALAPLPLELELFDENGVLMPGEEIFFTIESGGGQVPSSLVTDASGRVQAFYTLSDTWQGAEPVIVAYHPGGTPQRFGVTWRGIEVLEQVRGKAVVKIRHSEPFSAVTVAMEPAASAPFVTSVYGTIWTSILNPSANLVVIGDGIGLTGTVTTGFVTDAQSVRVMEVTAPPQVIGDVLLQAYAIDYQEVGLQAAMVSNPVRIAIR